MSPPESEAFPDAEGSQAYKQHYVCYVFQKTNINNWLQPVQDEKPKYRLFISKLQFCYKTLLKKE